MCLLHTIIPIVFATDLMRAQRMPFQKIRSYGYEPRLKSPDLPQNILKHSLNSCGHV